MPYGDDLSEERRYWLYAYSPYWRRARVSKRYLDKHVRRKVARDRRKAERRRGRREREG